MQVRTDHLRGADPRFFVAAAHCWCGWPATTPSPLSGDYFLCERCGTHYARARIRPEAVPQFYSLQGYWHERQRGKAHPTLWERSSAFERDGRVGLWLELIRRHAPASPGTAVEIGCAEGSLLAALRSAGWQTCGIEPDPATAAEVSHKTGLKVLAGTFPGAPAPACELLIACDVLEHAPDPRAFLRSAFEALRPGGTLFLQLPLLEEGRPDFGAMNDKVFDWCEHAFIFTRKSLALLLESCGFSILANSDAWNPAHEICIARKRPPAERLPETRLANLEEMFSPAFTGWMNDLNAFAAPLGLRVFKDWAKIWEYPALWFGGLNSLAFQGLSVLDIGSELSPLPWLLARKGARVTLVEARGDFVGQWEHVRRELNLSQVDWRIAGGSDLPFESDAFDLVTSFSVIEHQEDKKRAIDEMVRVLQPGGSLAMSFDVCEPGLGMTYPEWNGRALTLQEFGDLVWSHPGFGKTGTPPWNHADIAPFLRWHRQTAPHHTYTTGTALLEKKSG